MQYKNDASSFILQRIKNAFINYIKVITLKE